MNENRENEPGRFSGDGVDDHQIDLPYAEEEGYLFEHLLDSLGSSNPMDTTTVGTGSSSSSKVEERVRDAPTDADSQDGFVALSPLMGASGSPLISNSWELPMQPNLIFQTSSHIAMSSPANYLAHPFHLRNQIQVGGVARQQQLFPTTILKTGDAPALEQVANPDGVWTIKIENLEGMTFRREYQRNNKSDGKKHLKCFPYCGPNHRKSAHPCTFPIKLVYSFQKTMPSFGGGRGNDTGVLLDSSGLNLTAFARFICQTEENNASKPMSVSTSTYVDRLTGLNRDMQVGESFPISQIDKFVKSKSNPKGLLFSGQRTDQQTHPLGESGTFRFQERAWHYGWAAARFKETMYHCLRFYIFERRTTVCEGGTSTEMLICRAIVNSPSFTLISSRFKYNKRKREMSGSFSGFSSDASERAAMSKRRSSA